MARPRKEGLDYFPLDCRMNDKIEMLESVHGLIGFAIYIKIIQEMYQTKDGKIRLNNSKFSTWKIWGKRYGIEEKKLLQIISDMVEIQLFQKKSYNRHILTSDGVQKRLEAVNTLRDRDRTRKDSIPGGKPMEKYTKESKVKESKVKGNQPRLSPDLESKIKEVHESGFNISALINQFRKESRLAVELPDSVYISVCNAFIKYKPEKPWPYFKKVLKGESERHCISLQKEQAKTGEINQEGLDKLKELISGIGDLT
jgi:hypothetical protein